MAIGRVIEHSLDPPHFCHAQQRGHRPRRAAKVILPKMIAASRSGNRTGGEGGFLLSKLLIVKQNLDDIAASAIQ